MNYDKDLEKSWGDISEIVEQYLYNNLPSTFGGYLLQIGERNLLHLLNDVEKYMTKEHWMYVEMGRIRGQKHLPLLKPELFDYFKSNNKFMIILLSNGGKRLIDKLPFIENHYWSRIAAIGGYTFYRIFNPISGDNACMINFIRDMTPKTIYPFTLHPDYPRIKHLLLHEAITGRNLKLAMFILKPYVMVLDPWVVKCLPMPDSLENLLHKRISKTTNPRSITYEILCLSAINYGMYPVALELNRNLTLSSLKSPSNVCGYLACMMCNNETEYVRELIKYDYTCEDTVYLIDAVDELTPIEIIKLINFTTHTNPRVRLYKEDKVAVDNMDYFTSADIPALMNPSLVCSQEFKISLIEHISYPVFHPLYNRNKYAKYVKQFWLTW